MATYWNADTKRIFPGELALTTGMFTGWTVINKFGQNIDVDAAEDIWDGGGNYTGQPTTGSAETITITSGAGATDEALTIEIQGLDANYAAISETVTLNASGVGVSTGEYWRCFRGIVNDAASGQTSNAGVLTATHTTTTANVFFAIPIGYGQTQVCAYTIPDGYVGYVTQYAASVFDNTANRCQMAGIIREFGKAERIVKPFVISTDTRDTLKVWGGIEIPAKADIKLRCIAVQNANANITGEFDIVIKEIE